MTKVGVIVGRFQVPELHAGHKKLISQCFNENDRTIIVIGVSPIIDKRNPLTGSEVYSVVQGHIYDWIYLYGKEYPNILFINDNMNDSDWILNLKELIRPYTGLGTEVKYYGSRDSYLNVLKKYCPPDCILVPEVNGTSSTKIRESIALDQRTTVDFLKGKIAQEMNRFDCVYPTVDMLINTCDGKYWVFGRKKAHNDKFCIIGGFVDPKDNSYDFAIRREVSEETGIFIDPSSMSYLGSCQTKDWRFKKSNNKQITTMFVGKATTHEMKPGDDIDEIVLLKENEILNKLQNFIPSHQYLLGYFFGTACEKVKTL